MVGEDGEPGLWASFGTALRLIFGWFSVAIGALNLLVVLDHSTGADDGPYLLYHATLLVGGVVLLALKWIRVTAGRAGLAAFGATLVVGTLVSAAPTTTTACCMPAFAVRHGFPYPFLARDDLPGAAGRWHLDAQHLLADLVFWSYFGLLALILVALTRRTGRAPRHAHAPTTGSGTVGRLP